MDRAERVAKHGGGRAVRQPALSGRAGQEKEAGRGGHAGQLHQDHPYGDQSDGGKRLDGLGASPGVPDENEKTFQTGEIRLCRYRWLDLYVIGHADGYRPIPFRPQDSQRAGNIHQGFGKQRSEGGHRRACGHQIPREVAHRLFHGNEHESDACGHIDDFAGREYDLYEYLFTAGTCAEQYGSRRQCHRKRPVYGNEPRHACGRVFHRNDEE